MARRAISACARGDRQVQDEFDVVGGQERVDRERPDAGSTVGDRLRPGRVEVGDGDEVDVREPRGVWRGTGAMMAPQPDDSDV